MDMVTSTTESLVHSPESELPVAKPKIQDGSSLGGEQAQREGGRCDPPTGILWGTPKHTWKQWGQKDVSP